MMNTKAMLLFSVILLGIPLCDAEIIIVDAYDTGWYDDAGLHNANNSNNSTGIAIYDTMTTELRSFFVFSIPEITDEIIDVTLCLEATYYWSDDPYEDIRISPVSTPIDILTTGHGSSQPLPKNQAIFNDLANGPELSVLKIDLFYYSRYGKPGPLFCSTFNEFGRELVQSAAGNQFAIGLHILELSGDRNEGVAFSSDFGDTTVRIHQLQITTIPEPATMLFFAIGAFYLKRGNSDNKSCCFAVESQL